MDKPRHSRYSSGSCNIGPKEIRKRYAFGALGFVISAVLFYLLLLYRLDYLYFLLSFFPLLVGFIGLYQGYFKFCVANAYRGVYDLSDVGGGKGMIRDDAAHREDMKHARVLIYYAVLSAIAVAVVATVVSAVVL